MIESCKVWRLHPNNTDGLTLDALRVEPVEGDAVLSDGAAGSRRVAPQREAGQTREGDGLLAAQPARPLAVGDSTGLRARQSWIRYGRVWLVIWQERRGRPKSVWPVPG